MAFLVRTARAFNFADVSRYALIYKARVRLPTPAGFINVIANSQDGVDLTCHGNHKAAAAAVHGAAAAAKAPGAAAVIRAEEAVADKESPHPISRKCCAAAKTR